MTKKVTLIAVVKVMKKNRRNPMLLQVDVLRKQVSSKRIKKFLVAKTKTKKMRKARQSTVVAKLEVVSAK